MRERMGWHAPEAVGRSVRYDEDHRRSLDAVLASGELPDDVDTREMAQRASDQLERLTDAHATAARRAFGGAVR